MRGSFIRVLFDAKASFLSLPPQAYERFWLDNGLPENDVTIYGEHEYKWKVEMGTVKDKLYFCRGWSNVVSDLLLQFGYSLLFEVGDESYIFLTVFDYLTNPRSVMLKIICRVVTFDPFLLSLC